MEKYDGTLNNGNGLLLCSGPDVIALVSSLGWKESEGAGKKNGKK